MRTFVAEFFSPLTALVPSELVELRGAWSTSHRKTYAKASQLGSGMGPLVDVVDAQWSGTVESRTPLAGIAVLNTGTKARWVKSAPAMLNANIYVSFTSVGAHAPRRATFTARLHGAILPGVPVDVDGDVTVTRHLRTNRIETGRAHFLVEVPGAAFVVLFLPSTVLKVGRNRLWRVLDDLALALPPELRRVLTKGRTGELQVFPQQAGDTPDD